jgi:GDP-L-fucose synthase
VSRVSALGWQPRIPLDQGLAATYRWFLEHRAPGAPGSGATRAEEAAQ